MTISGRRELRWWSVEAESALPSLEKMERFTTWEMPEKIKKLAFGVRDGEKGGVQQSSQAFNITECDRFLFFSF